ncbi:MAG: RidA family protein [Rhodospirillales bacterium]|jgi:enamine deaminase RidA (YjgF/YER057c/UK114 family)|nr:RidA family protein [Rhodospirillales bacterium]
MLKTYNPAAVAGPFGHYDHAVEAPAGARWLHVSGQVAITDDGDVPDGIDAQADHVWKSLIAIMSDAGMGPENVVKTTTYLLDAGHFPQLRAARERYLGQCKAASTTVVILGLARPELLVEIDLVAAAP